MEATNILALVAYARKRTENTIYLFLLALTSLIQTLFIQYVDLDLTLDSPVFNRLTNISIYFYLAFEITFCLSFMRTCIRNEPVKGILSLSNIIFVIAIVYYLISYPTSRKIVSNLGIIEGFIIITPGLYYFYELFRHPSYKSILHNSEFWAITGMLFLFSLITPFFLALDHLKRDYPLLEKKLYIINNIAYSIMFTMFAIAILCSRKPKGQTSNSLS